MSKKGDEKKLLISIFVFLVILYFITSPGDTAYNYFTRLAGAFLKGKIYLEKAPQWLNELIPADGNKFFVPYPPMPAVLSTPLVLIFKDLFKQQYLAHILGAGIAVLTAKLSLVLKKGIKVAAYMGILSGAGTIIWYLSANGSSWYLGQITAAFFLLAAIVESFAKKRPLFVGVFLGAAYLSRIQTILSLPLFIYLLKDTFKNRGYVNFALGLIPFLLFNAYYNYTRFGVVWDKGYMLIPGVLEELWYQKGIFDVSYIPRHIKAALFSLPKLTDKPPFIIPSIKEMAIWVTTPAFIYIFWSSFKKTLIKFIWLSIFLISIPIFVHGTTGFTQFGYRFAVDFYPLLFLLIIIGLKKNTLKLHHYLLLFISILVNFWGVFLINFLELYVY
jgi:hypothetical protein